MADHRTDTSKWALAIHRVTQTSVEVWVGTLFPFLEKPKKARVRVIQNKKRIQTIEILSRQWSRPFQNTDQRFYALLRIQGLQPGHRYEVKFDRFVEALPGYKKACWEYLRYGCFNTLPNRIPSKAAKPFTIGMGSCFYYHRDGGQAATAYKALYERGASRFQPTISFLMGDQVYLDIGFDSLSKKPDEIRQRIGDDYARNWQDLGAILNRGGTWMLPDDHEYWNNFPFYKSANPYLYRLRNKKVREVWTQAARDGVERVQGTRRCESFSIGGDLSVCLADIRSHRSKNGFMRTEDMDHVVHWAENLSCPGVLGVSQPLIVDPQRAERNILSYKSQYKRLLEALATSGHDIVVLSGDVHFGRIASCTLGKNGGRLIEVISSPLSNLTYLNGLFTSTPRHVPKWFPHKSAIPSSWSRAKIRYSSANEVKSKRGFLFSAYPRKRTAEHFMTLSFNREPRNAIRLLVQAWRARERTGPKNLPKAEFKVPYTTILK